MTEASKHLTYFKVENFKCFDSFELEDIGQFNLILGDNNVGKTSVLEALLYNQENSILLNIGNFVSIFNYKTKVNDDLQNPIDFKFENSRIVAFKNFLHGNESTEIKFYLKLGTNAFEQSLDINTLRREGLLFRHFVHLPIIYSFELYDEDLSIFYSSQIQTERKKKRELIENLKVMIPNLENLEISVLNSETSPIIIIDTADNENSLPLSIFGDGTIKLFRYLIDIIRATGNRLMIDEIDSGIHYSRFKDYWRTIIKSAASNNVQLFMTTHNVECLKYLKEVLEEEDMQQYQEKTRSYTLLKLPDGHIKAYKYNFTQFEYCVVQGLEMRGGANG